MKPTLSRVFDTNKIIEAFARVGLGQAGSDFVEYLSSFVEQALRGMRNGFTFSDNIDCEIKTVSLSTNTAQIVNLTTSRQPVGAFVTRVVSTSYYLKGFNWYLSNTGEFTVIAEFSGPPPAGTKLDVQLIILF